MSDCNEVAELLVMDLPFLFFVLPRLFDLDSEPGDASSVAFRTRRLETTFFFLIHMLPRYVWTGTACVFRGS